MANRISLNPQGFYITFFWKYLATGEVFSKENITLTLVSISLNRQKEREDSLQYTNLLFFVVSGFGLLPNCICMYKCDAGSNTLYFSVLELKLR